MLAVVHSRALDGLSAPCVRVEVHIGQGLPAFTLVGLPDTEVRESRDRVRAAIINSGFSFPNSRITVNLAPADLPKESGGFDLPIAIGILAASMQIASDDLEQYEFIGELSLSGALHRISGALVLALAAKDRKRTFIIPPESAAEAALVAAETVLEAPSLAAVCAHLSSDEKLKAPQKIERAQLGVYPDLSDVYGQFQARRALEIAAAGGHSLLMSGPPGSGKSMLASRLPSILPPMSDEQAKESAAILSLINQFRSENFGIRQFRAPHHTASAVALVGGGNPPKPGEISLAHAGILFLDELPEFSQKVLDSLREPLESGEIHVARAGKSATFPARFQLVAAMNPCPCGYYGAPNARCRCTNAQIERYQSRLSGPFLDRIDLFIEVPAVPTENLANKERGESSAIVQQRVLAAQNFQKARQGKLNAALTVAEVDRFCTIDPQAQNVLTQATQSLKLSARAYHRVLRLARTNADLELSAQIQTPHMLEAIQYRRFRDTKNF